MRIAEAPISTSRDQGTLARMNKVSEKCLIVFGKNLRSWRHLQHCIGTGRTSPIRAHTMFAITGLEMLLIAEIDQRVEVGNAFNPNIAALAAIAAIRAAEFNKFLPPEGKAAISSVSGADIYLCLI
jgi:hypothetical protein